MMKRARDFLQKWWPSILVTLLALAATTVLVCWGHKDLGSYNPRPRDEIIRNYGLLIAAFWAAVLAVWRSQVASRQVEASERGLSDGRFQKGADMLGSQDFATRMGGIYALERLAREHPEGYRDQAIKLLAAFVRQPVRDKEIEKRIREAETQSRASGHRFREDVWEAVRTIGHLNSDESEDADKPNLMGANLEKMYFTGKNFSGLNFGGAQLKGVILKNCNLTGATFKSSDLSHAHIMSSNCTNADFADAHFANNLNLRDTDISGANFTKARGFNQTSLDHVCLNPENPPNIPPSNGSVWDPCAAIKRWEEKDKEAGGRVPDETTQRRSVGMLFG